MLSNAIVQVVIHVLFDLTIGRVVQQSHSHDADHTLRREVLHVVRVLRLAFDQLEDGAVQQAAERIVVEFTHWHLVNHLIIVFDELLNVLEHLSWVAAAHDFSVCVSLRLRLRLHARVELNLRLELLVRLLFFPREVQADFLEDSALLEHFG